MQTKFERSKLAQSACNLAELGSLGVKNLQLPEMWTDGLEFWSARGILAFMPSQGR